MGSSEQMEGFSCITLFLGVSSLTAVKSFTAVLGRWKVQRQGLTHIL